MNHYIQPYTFYLIVWLVTLMLTLGAGFLLGFFVRDKQTAKLTPKSGQPIRRSDLLEERKSIFSYR